MLTLDLTNAHISDESLHCCDLSDGSQAIYDKMKNIFPSIQ